MIAAEFPRLLSCIRCTILLCSLLGIIITTVHGEGLSIIQSVTDFNADLDIVFVGNSYTYYNGGLDNMVQLILNANALPSPTPIIYESFTKANAGQTLSQHSYNFSAHPTIFGSGIAWDWIVLQEQSQIPVRDVNNPCKNNPSFVLHSS
jgi:hypothetical protein